MVFESTAIQMLQYMAIYALRARSAEGHVAMIGNVYLMKIVRSSIFCKLGHATCLQHLFALGFGAMVNGMYSAQQDA